MVTSGKKANEVKAFNFIGSLVDSQGQTYSANSTTLTVNHRAQLGSDAETVESIKYNAPDTTPPNIEQLQHKTML